MDLFVRVSNSLAIGMYEKFGYSVYRRVLGYYASDTDAEDAFGELRCAIAAKLERSADPLIIF